MNWRSYAKQMHGQWLMVLGMHQGAAVDQVSNTERNCVYGSVFGVPKLAIF